jgi:hypothetical protein
VNYVQARSRRLISRGKELVIKEIRESIGQAFGELERASKSDCVDGKRVRELKVVGGRQPAVVEVEKDAT